jgi:hypothetical protein
LLPQITQFLADAKIDVAIVTETWLHDNNTKIVKAQFRGNFSVVSTTRNGRRGGGFGIMRTAEDLHQPIKMLITRGDKPWMTLEIKRLIQKRHRLHHQGSKKRWKQLVRLIKRKIAEDKKQYNRKKYSTANHDYWKKVKSIADQSLLTPRSPGPDEMSAVLLKGSRDGRGDHSHHATH